MSLRIIARYITYMQHTGIPANHSDFGGIIQIFECKFRIPILYAKIQIFFIFWILQYENNWSKG